jgi:hypothetical protein
LSGCGHKLSGGIQSYRKFFQKKSPKISFGLQQIVELGSGKFNPYVQPDQAVPNFCEKCIIFAAINMELQAPIIIEAD